MRQIATMSSNFEGRNHEIPQHTILIFKGSSPLGPTTQMTMQVFRDVYELRVTYRLLVHLLSSTRSNVPFFSFLTRRDVVLSPTSRPSYGRVIPLGTTQGKRESKERVVDLLLQTLY